MTTANGRNLGLAITAESLRANASAMKLKFAQAAENIANIVNVLAPVVLVQMKSA